jgi:DNA ligase-1
MVKNGEIIKVKPTLSLDLRVLQVHVAEGIKTGRPVHTIDVWYNGVRTRVGSGIPHSFNDVPQAGQIVEIECMGLTLTGALREPRFKGIRLDKEQPDVSP